MIVRRLESHLLLITQSDHAALAARIMTAWRAGGFRERASRARVLEATRLHDMGWAPVDAAPTVDPETGMPYDVVNVPVAVRQAAWPRALDQLAPQDRYAAALVAQHAITVYRRFGKDPEWEEFFANLQRRRDEFLEAEQANRDGFLQDYAMVGMGDRLSLAFCYGWPEADGLDPYRARLHAGVNPLEQADSGVVDGGRLEIKPDPFDGTAVPLSVAARLLPVRRFASDADLRKEMARARVVEVSGVAAA